MQTPAYTGKSRANPRDPRLAGFEQLYNLTVQLEGKLIIRGDIVIQIIPSQTMGVMFYSDCQLLGQIFKDGWFRPTDNLHKKPQPYKAAIWYVLQALREDPLRGIRELGHRTNHCCVCGRELSDPTSVERGIGPVCEGRLMKAREPKFNLAAILDKEIW